MRFPLSAPRNRRRPISVCSELPRQSQPALPVDGIAGTAKLRRSRLEVREVIDNGPNGELTLHVVLSLKTVPRQEIAVNSPQAAIEHIDE